MFHFSKKTIHPQAAAAPSSSSSRPAEATAQNNDTRLAATGTSVRMSTRPKTASSAANLSRASRPGSRGGYGSRRPGTAGSRTGMGGSRRPQTSASGGRIGGAYGQSQAQLMNSGALGDLGVQGTSFKAPGRVPLPPPTREVDILSLEQQIAQEARSSSSSQAQAAAARPRPKSAAATFGKQMNRTMNRTFTGGPLSSEVGGSGNATGATNAAAAQTTDDIARMQEQIAGAGEANQTQVKKKRPKTAGAITLDHVRPPEIQAWMKEIAETAGKPVGL